MKKLLYWLFGKPVTPDFDTGLRGTVEGRLYVDKKVFYCRKEVREAIESVKNSEVIRQMIESHRRVWK